MLTKEEVLMDRYIINEKTMYIRAVVQSDGVYSIVQEFNEKPMLVKKRPCIIMEETCYYYQTTYTVRKEISRDIGNISHKPPIILRPETSTYLFPTHSDRLKECSWINLQYVHSFKKKSMNETFVIFDDQTEILFPVSEYVMNHQFLNTIKLEYLLRTKSMKVDQVTKLAVNFEKSKTSIFEVLAMYAMLDQSKDTLR